MHRLEMDYKYTRLEYCNARMAGLPSNTIKHILGWTTAMLLWLVFHQTQSNIYK